VTASTSVAAPGARDVSRPRRHRRPRLVVLGLLTRLPYAGVVWQTRHYLEGFAALGYDVHYVDAHGSAPLSFFTDDGDDGWRRAADWLGTTMRLIGFGDAWAYAPAHAEGRRFGPSAAHLDALYRDAALIVNLHGGTEPTDAMSASDRLVYLETDPVQLQVELDEDRSWTIDFLDAHVAWFSFAENLGHAGCGLAADLRFPFQATRQPVVVGHWDRDDVPPADAAFTTVANWRQSHRNVVYRGETYWWSKHREFAKIIDLPGRVDAPLELALAKVGDGARQRLTERGWRVVDAAGVTAAPESYRDYIWASAGELTCAKDQNVRLATGWFSDRSATYLAAGRPVVTQDTGFARVLGDGAGLLAFTDEDSAAEALDAVCADYERHARAARDLARECFDAPVVLGALLDHVGLPSKVSS
jgi:hypothetical protein